MASDYLNIGLGQDCTDLKKNLKPDKRQRNIHTQSTSPQERIASFQEQTGQLKKKYERTTIPYGQHREGIVSKEIFTEYISEKKKSKASKRFEILSVLLGIYGAIIVIISFMYFPPASAFVLTSMSILGMVVISLLLLAMRINIK